MSEVTRHPSICRFCTTGCPVVVDVQNGRAIRVVGNRNSPSYDGFCCTRGQAVPEQLNNPGRLLNSLKRGADGDFSAILSLIHI